MRRRLAFLAVRGPSFCYRYGTPVAPERLQRWMESGSRSTAMVAAYFSTKSAFRPPDLRILSPWAGMAYKHHGYTRAAYRTRVVEEALWRMFRVQIPATYSLEAQRGRKYYRAAAQHLIQAEGSTYSNPSRYVSQVDNFNQLILAILPPKVTGTPIRPDKVFQRIGSPSATLQARLPDTCPAFLSCHKLRRRSPEPHAYAIDFHDLGRLVTSRQRKQLTVALRNAYAEVVRTL